MRGTVLIISFVLAVGCGAGRDFKKAVGLEEAGQRNAAIEAYEKFIEEYPADERGFEASYRAGKLYSEVASRCPEALRHFERVARSKGPWSEKARLALLNCPDYFPFRKGAKWTYVDSDSGGENMRLVLQVVSSSAGVHNVIAGSYYAGEERFQGYSRSYARVGWSLWETVGKDRVPILRFPLQKGRKWTVRVKENIIRYKIVSDKKKVRVKAGKFKNCLKIKAHTKGYSSWVYDYYCPNVGRVKTTVGAAGIENPNTELASYHIP